MKTQIDDEELIKRCKRELPYGHQSFELLIGKYKDLVYTLCYRLVGKPGIAEDLMQEIFTKVFLSLAKFEERSKFSSWVYRITHNHCLDYIHRRNREAEVISQFTEEKQRQIKTPQDFSVKLQDALDKILPDQRGILIMKYVMGLTLNEISETLEISPAAVKMRLLRAREDFRQVYEVKEND